MASDCLGAAGPYSVRGQGRLETQLKPQFRITRRAVASDCLGTAGPYSVRGQGRPETQSEP